MICGYIYQTYGFAQLLKKDVIAVSNHKKTPNS